jgi:hypothetical protein
MIFNITNKVNTYIQKLISFYQKKEIKLEALILILNTINLFLYTNSSICIINTILIFSLYFHFSEISFIEKKKLILIWFTFSFYTIIGESILINLSKGKSISYNNNDIANVSSWLFSAYASMTMGVFFNQKFYNHLLD